MLDKIYLVVLYMVSALQGQSEAYDITNVDELYENITRGPNRKVGFLRRADFATVAPVLPETVEPVYCDGNMHHGVTCAGDSDLYNLVKNETLLAGLREHAHGYDESVDSFSSTLISPRAMLMVPDFSYSMPHGVRNPDQSSKDLSLALNAAITRVQEKGLDQKARLDNMPFHFLEVYTCKSDKGFPLPNKINATGLLRKVLDTKILKISSLGKVDWGHNGGNYQVDPPTGFYPDLMDAIFNEFRNLSGPDGVVYGDDLQLKRVWAYDLAYRELFDGNAYATEPYFHIDSTYWGTWESCTNNSDCRRANLPDGREFCTEYNVTAGSLDGNTTTSESPMRCEHPQRAVIDFFRISCTTLGTDTHFFTKRTGSGDVIKSKKTSSLFTPGIQTAIIMLCLLSVIEIIGIVVVIYRERHGEPLFAPHSRYKQISKDTDRHAMLAKEGNSQYIRESVM